MIYFSDERNVNLLLHICLNLHNMKLYTARKIGHINRTLQLINTTVITGTIFHYNYKCGHRHVLSKRQVWMSIFHIINLKKNNHGLLFLLKVRSCVFISNVHHSPPPPPKGYTIVSLILN